MAECILLKSGGGTGSDDCTATKANVLSGCTAVTKDSDDEAMAGTMANKGAWTSRIGVNGKAIIPMGYHNGSGYVDQAITNRGAVNASLAINGTYTIPEGYHNGAGKVTQSIATMGAQIITPGNSQKVVSCSGKYMTGNVTVPAVTNLTAANIKKGVNVGGVVGTWEGYVAAPTDLYYKGVNNAGIALIPGINHSATFQTTHIREVATTENSIMTYDIGTRNFAGYSNLYFEWYCESYRPSSRPNEYGYQISISKSSDSINGAISNQVVNIVAGGSYTNIVSLRNIQTTDHWYITTRWNKTYAGYGTIQIKRIWLA